MFKKFRNTIYPLLGLFATNSQNDQITLLTFLLLQWTCNTSERPALWYRFHFQRNFDTYVYICKYKWYSHLSMMYSLSSKKVSIRAIMSYLWNSFKNWKPLVGQQIKRALDSWTIFSRHEIRNSFSQIVFKRLAYNWPSILECETNTTSITQKR